MDIEKNGYIKLPYGFVSNEKDKEKIRFNLPINYKKDLLFRKVPYFAEVNNSAINDVVSGKKKDDLSIQKFLLSKGVLEDAILDNLDMIVTDRKFNNVSIRRKLDKKYPSIMKKPTVSNFLFRDKKQFDLQNPVIGGLYNQLKIRTAGQLELLRKAPKIKDLKIQSALDRLKKFNLNEVQQMMMMTIMIFLVYLDLEEENHHHHHHHPQMMMMMMIMLMIIKFKKFY